MKREFIWCFIGSVVEVVIGIVLLWFGVNHIANGEILDAVFGIAFSVIVLFAGFRCAVWCLK